MTAMTTPSFSVIIPVLNEERSIRTTIEDVMSLCSSAEVIVVDGGSSDRTREIVERYPVRLVNSAKGRGTQLNAGASVATGDIFLFLHADTRLPGDAFAQINMLFQSPNVQLARFRLKFDHPHRLLRFYSFFTRLESFWTSFGDQCLVVRRSFFENMGRFPDWPLFEDVHFLRTARSRTTIHIFPAWVTTSSRRFLKQGIVRQQMNNAKLLMRYLIGESPEQLVLRYEKRKEKPMVKVISLFLVMLLWGGGADVTAETVSHEIFDTYLQTHVKNGLVNYTDACRDSHLEDYLQQMSQVSPEQLPSDKSRMAYWINVYNAATIRLICDHYPLSSISELHKGGLVLGTITKRTAWDRKFIQAGDQVLTLNHVEHEILRPVFKDPRVHFAIVCAAMGCPPLRSEAYTGERLDEQLDDQGKIFLSDMMKNRFDEKKRRADLSPIFSWFKKDFGRGDKDLLMFVSRFVSPETRKALHDDDFNWSVKYTFYDWSLNSQ